MRLFTKQDKEKLDRLQYERDTAFESAQRLMEANLRFLEEQNRIGEVVIRLTSEVVRLTQRQVPVVPEGDFDQPKSVRDNDSVVLEDSERRPAPPRPARTE